MGKEEVPVKGVVLEKTHVGRVAFPESVPDGLIEYFVFPGDLIQHAKEMELNDHTQKFLMAVLRGRWAITAGVNLPDVAGKTGLTFPEMDRIVRDLVQKNYARMNDRLDLYRMWICLLHVKGVRFVQADE